MWLSFFFFARSSSKKNSNPVANTDSIITAHGDDLTAICSQGALCISSVFDWPLTLSVH